MTPDEYVAGLKDCLGSLERAIGKIIACPHTQQDVLQDALMTAWRKRDQFKGDSTFSTWMHTIARRTAYNRLNQKFERDFTQLDFEVEQTSTPEMEVVAWELQKAINANYRNMSGKKRQALELVHLQGLTTDELAEALGVSRSTAAMRVMSGRKALMEAV